ncbi:MAG: Holliday junction branch migration protein RuvA [Patescibacteria group bacterium]|jgi:Holliday junction DNA helicase RuvA
MLGYLRGQIIAITEKSLVLETGGVGYLVFTTAKNLGAAKIGETAEFYLHTNVREDALELYGLPTIQEIEFFKRLIGISGVGPRTALGIFEVARLADIKKAIAQGDPGLLTKVSGIGKKTAELIIIKLKDKTVDLADSDGVNPSDHEALDALVSLGYTLPDARQALSQLPPDIATTEDKIKLVLKSLAKH